MARARAGAPLASTRRKRRFWAAQNRAGRCFDTDSVWTFHLWQHVVVRPAGPSAAAAARRAAALAAALLSILYFHCYLLNLIFKGKKPRR